MNVLVIDVGGTHVKILATGPSGASEELGPLRDAGHEVIIGRALDQPGRIAYTEAARPCATST